MKTTQIKKELYVITDNKKELNTGQYISKEDIPNFENDVTVTKVLKKTIAGGFIIWAIDAIIIE